MIKKIVQDRILQISFIILIICLCISPTSISSIDNSTILSLFSLMLVVRVLESSHLLDNIAIFMVSKSDNKRKLVRLLLLISAGSAMVVTNDVAIITFVPIIVKVSLQTKIKPFIPITLITISANLGSSISPIGNPQNIYLMTSNHLSLVEFFKMSLPFGLISIILLFTLTFLFSKEKITVGNTIYREIDRLLLMKTFIMLIVILMGIFSLIPIVIVSVLTVVFLFLIHRQNELKEIDYALLLTFCCFFLIVGSLSQLSSVSLFLESVTKSQSSIYLTSIVLSQVMSNVPSVILLSHYTTHLLPLFLGVSVGGLGTLVASLANLLAFKQCLIYYKESGKQFLFIFSFINLICLLILGVACYFII